MPNTWDRTYLGAPRYSLQSVGGAASAIRLQNNLLDATHRGWISSASHAADGAIRLEIRFNPLVQGDGTSTGEFLGLWLLDASNSNKFDYIALSQQRGSSTRFVIAQSSIDSGVLRNSPVSFANNTWYRLVITGSPSARVRLSLLSDNETTEIAAVETGHTLSSFGSGIRFGFSQATAALDTSELPTLPPVGFSPNELGRLSPPLPPPPELPSGLGYPSDVAIDWIRLTRGASSITRAIRTSPFLRTGVLRRNDDGFVGPVDLGFPVNFFGQVRTSVYINNNGNITFDGPYPEYSPQGLTGLARAIIAPFFADVDTSNPSSGEVTFGVDYLENGKTGFAVNYLDVGHYSRADRTNSFQLVLIERAETGAGNFDIEFNYDRISWETGDASGGTNGLGGNSAAVGWSNGLTGAANRSFQLRGSLIPGSFLDSGPTGLRSMMIDSDIPGRLRFEVRNGTVGAVSVSPSMVTLSSGQTQQFQATVAGASGGVTWSISPILGTITSGGLYTAPPNITGSPAVVVRATSVAVPSRSGTATVSLSPGCIYRLSPESVSVSQAGGSSSVTVTTGAGCGWQAASSAPFARITSSATGLGNGTISFTVDANTTGIPRSARLSIGDQTLVVNQSGSGCLPSLMPASANIGAPASTGTITLTLPASNCAWTAIGNVPWISVTPASGSGAGSISFSASANGSATGRSGTITVAGLTFAISQAGSDCSGIALSSVDQAFPSGGGAGTLAVSSPSGCGYSAMSSAGFVVINSGGSGTGSGVITFTVQANQSGAERSGIISVSRPGTSQALTFTVRQSANVTPTITCNVQEVALPTSVRSLGRTELLSPLDVECTGSSGGVAVTGDIVVTLNANFTNRLRDPGETSDAVLTGPGTTSYAGTVDGVNAVRFPGVVLSAGEASISRRFRITGLRADVSSLGSSASGIDVKATVTVRSPVRVVVTNPVRVAGQSKPPISVVALPSPASRVQTLFVQEAFPNVFKTSSSEAGPGQANTGTRLRVRISRAGSGVSILVPVSASFGRLRLVSFNTDGSGESSIQSLVRQYGAYAQVPLTSGTGWATYEVLEEDPVLIESAQIVILVENATQAQFEQLLFDAKLAPLNETTIASRTAPLPRFADPETSSGSVNLRISGLVQSGSRPAEIRTPVAVGSSATFNYVLVNDSDRQADSVIVRNNLPPGLENPICFTNRGTCSVNGSEVRVNVGTMAGGDRVNASVTAGVSGLPNCPNCGATTIINVASIGGSQPDPDLTNNSTQTAIDTAECALSVGRGTVTGSAGGSSASVSVTTGPTCEWTIPNRPAWVQISPQGPYRGSVTLNLSMSANQGPAREGNVNIGDRIVRMTQSAAGCTTGFSPSTVSMPANGGTVQIALQTGAGCAWEALSLTDWLRITSATTGTGPSSLTLSAQVNAAAFARQGFLEVMGQRVEVSQPSSAPPPGSSAGLRFVAISPCRVMETRPEYNFEGRTGAFGPPYIRSGETRTLAMAQSNVCRLPATAKAYVVNITLVPRGGLDFVTIWPGGESRPEYWTARSPDGQIVANSAIVKAGNGAIQVYASNDADMIIDISGYYTDDTNVPNLAYYPLTPCRVVETRIDYRSPPGPFGPPSLNANQARRFRFPASTLCPIPAGAAAYSVTITAVPEGPLQYLTAWPAGTGQPNISYINSPSGRVLANSVIVPASGDGSVDVLAFNRSDFIIDINGYYAPDNGQGLFYFPVTQCRVSDTRNAAGAYGGPIFADDSSRTIAIPRSSCAGIPTTARGYVLNATALPNGSPMPFLTLWPTGQARPNASVLNAFQGQIATNSAIIPAGSDGSIDLYAFRRTHVVLEVSGYFGR
ncbi:MAG: hypothetical protein JNL98_12285 [Bryobacterales bacterium]|nr:hypothetical protein [Bryobacterales bacterium]